MTMMKVLFFSLTKLFVRRVAGGRVGGLLGGRGRGVRGPGGGSPRGIGGIARRLHGGIGGSGGWIDDVH